MPYLLRKFRLAVKCVWQALTTPDDPRFKHEVNFWNIPVRKRHRQLQ